MDGKKKEWPQYLIAALCCNGGFLFGLQVGWLAPFQTLLQSDDSPLGQPLSNTDISWIAALPSLSIFIGTPISGYLLDKFGRKMSALFIYIPYVLAYLILLFTSSVPMIYVSRILNGFGSAGGFVVAPVYIGETATEERRGFLCSMIGSCVNAGIIVSFALGGWTSYFTTNLILLIISSIFFPFYFWLPESPVYAENPEERLQIVKKLRGTNQESVTKELRRIHILLKANEESFHFINLFTHRQYWRPMLIVNGVWIVCMFSGYPAIIRYSVAIFEGTGSTFSPFWSSMILVWAQLIFALIGSSLIDRYGRKPVLVYCTAIMSLGILIFPIYLFLDLGTVSGFASYVPVSALTIFISAFAVAYITVPFVLISDLFSPAARASASSVGNITVSFLEFLVTKIYLDMTAGIGMTGSFVVFVVCCVLGLIFVYFVVVETKGFLLRLEKGNDSDTADVDPTTLKLLETNKNAIIHE